MTIHHLKLRQYASSVKRKVTCSNKFILSLTIFCIFFIIPTICDAYHYKIGDKSDDILFFNSYQKLINDNFALSLSREYRFGLPELAVTGLQFEYRMRDIRSKIGLFSSGDDIYRENRLIISGSNTLSIIIFHIGMSMDQTAIKGYNTITTNSARLAIGIAPHNKWKVTTGAYFDVYESVSTDRKIGKLWVNTVAYVRPQTVLCGALESNPYSVSTISLGFQEKVSDRLSVQISFRDNPMSLGGAIIITHKRMDFKISVQDLPPLGWINQIEVSFK